MAQPMITRFLPGRKRDIKIVTTKDNRYAIVEYNIHTADGRLHFCHQNLYDPTHELIGICNTLDEAQKVIDVIREIYFSYSKL